MEKDMILNEPPAYSNQTAAAIRPQARKLHDKDVTFEEYHYWAQLTREEERALPDRQTHWKEIILRKKPQQLADTEQSPNDSDAEKPDAHYNLNFSKQAARLEISDEEWLNASRAFRTATWGACFYLITTDILGPYGVGFAMGTLGWGPGITLYTVFGAMAGYSGYLLWHTYLGLDSHQFPLRNYGDLTFQLFGSIPRHTVNVMQALALLLILGQVTIQNGLAISQTSKFRLCYAVCPVLFIVAGFFLGQIRTLRSYGWVANLAVWLNLLVIFITMGVIANSPPNYAISVLGSAGSAVNSATITPDANGVYPAVMHTGGLPKSTNGLVGSINGLMSGVLAYSGAQLFVEFMSEMRRPRDFLKAMWGAQVFIWAVYLIYGCYVYYFQGQYSFQTSYQGVSSYAWQVVGDMIALISGLIAAGLYGNIGIKVLYNNVLVDVFSAPPLITSGGKIIWAIIVPIWWSIAYIVAAAIPDYFGFVAVISAALLLQFTYTFPPLLALGYDIQLQAMKADSGNGFDPVTGQTKRHWTGASRYLKAFFAGGLFQVALNTWHVIYFLASLTTAVLGMYAAIDGMIEAFKIPQVNSFSCNSPLNLTPQ